MNEDEYVEMKAKVDSLWKLHKYALITLGVLLIGYIAKRNM